MASADGPPPGLNYIAIIEPGLTFSLLGVFFGGMLVLLFMSSTPVSRRHPVFILNIFIIVLGLGLAAVNVGQEWSNMITPLVAIPNSLTLANIALNVYSPLIIDSILLFRLIAFYPRLTTPFTTYMMVLAFPFLIKTGRFVCNTLSLYHLGRVDGQGSITLLAAQSWFCNPYLMMEWILQMADNVYSTFFFFWKLRKFYNGNGNTFLLRDKTLLAQLRSLFVIALANFVFPLFLNVTHFILISCDHSYAPGAEGLLSNMYLSIFGVLLATVWASGNTGGRNNTKQDQSAFGNTFSNTPGYVNTSHTAVGSSTGTLTLPEHDIPIQFRSNGSRNLSKSEGTTTGTSTMWRSEHAASQTHAIPLAEAKADNNSLKARTDPLLTLGANS